jgi:hypothetical protein
LCQCKIARRFSGVAIFKGHFNIHQIRKTQLPCGFSWLLQNTHPKKRNSNSYERTVVKADTPTDTVTEGNGQYCAPWIVESPGGTVTTYTDIQCRNRRRQNNRSNLHRRRKDTANDPNS